MTAVEWVINEIDQQQKRYIDLAKKYKSIKKEVDAILTATTLLKMKCEQAKELEKEQIEDAYQQGFNNAYFSNPFSKEEYYNEILKTNKI